METAVFGDDEKVVVAFTAAPIRAEVAAVAA